ncbi:hypothetical protein TVAG_416000 [Trichomonas vaginalis G3]|uniref:Uncharacterized protein n=1 Tax=Trichomonas vaginalis (strain ATCC PRA-98 / G3) TaxID=412133 RepID=A2FXZ7_TRIV3|nr:hypothetical protein TVAGG3_0250150 [Trichomonas vaginalis G3]EAX90220.1 hypothetical protein TVAG_416000 [Trichomonas vaginalis G3]KAI5553942.1 hypothetical protein TVAGG3_0250150 [Trichomonas vaginalis G3]|eukprot:XP_001303150.1 hypothetical protein [Trichomonas vaginalis G3]
MFTTIFPTLMTYFKGDKSTGIYIIYIIFTGSPTYPNTDEVIVIVWFYFLIGAFIFVLYLFIIIVLLTTALPSSTIKRTYSILSFYILPFIVPIFGKAFTASMAYLSVSENSYSFYAALIGELTILLYAVLGSLMNSSSAYRVTHIYFLRDTFSALITNFFILIVQHTVSFLENPNNILLVILTIVFVAVDIYIFIVLPYQTKLVSILSCFYIFFCTGCAIVRAFTKYATPLGVIIIFAIAVVITAIMYCCRLCYEHSHGDLGRLFGLHRFRKSKASVPRDEIEKLNFVQLMVLARGYYSLDDQTQHYVNEEIRKRAIGTAEGRIFINSFDSRIGALTIESFPQVMEVIQKYTKKIEKKEKDFWASLWLSDFESLPEISGEIGRLKFRLYEYSKYQSKVIPSFVCDENIEPTYQRSVTHSVFNTIVVIIFLASLSLLVFLLYCYTLSGKNRTDFFEFQQFMENFTLMQSELYTPESVPRLSKYYTNTLYLVDQFKKVKSGGLYKFMNYEISNTTLGQLIDTYMNLTLLSNQTGAVNSLLLNNSIFYDLDKSLMDYYDFFDTAFTNRISIPILSWFVLYFLSFVIFVIFFVFALYIYARHLHRTFEVFKTFSKKKIEEFAGLDTKSIQRSVIPGRESIIEWSASTDIVVGFFLTLAAFIIFFTAGFVVYGRTLSDYNFRTKSYVYFERMDMIMLWLSAVVFQNSTSPSSPQFPQMISNSDHHMDILLRDSEAASYAALLTTDIVSFITGYTLKDPTMNDVYPITEINQTFINLRTLQDPFYNVSNIYYITWMVVLLLTIFSFIIIIHIQVNTGRQMDASRGERINLLSVFTDFAGEQESLSSIVPVNNASLPFLFVEANSDFTVTFSTNLANQEMGITNGSKFDGQPFGIVTGSEIMRTIEKLKQFPSSEPQQIKSQDGSYIYVIPSYCGATMTTLKSFAVFRLPSVLSPFINSGGDKNISPFSKLFPSVISPDKDFPHIIQINAAPFLVVLVRLTNISSWSAKVEPQFVESFYKAVIEQCDEICESGQLFMRVHVRDDTILFMTNPDVQIQGRWTFITNCADFSLKIREAVKTISKKYKSNVFTSVVFARGEKQVMYLGNYACTQCDFLPDTLDLQFVEQAFDIFRIDATAFATAHIPNLRIPNTTLIANYLSSSGTSIDLFLVA